MLTFVIVLYSNSPAFLTEMECKKIRTGIVLSFKSYREFSRFNPHFHSLILEGGFDEEGNSVYIPILDLTEMLEYFGKLSACIAMCPISLKKIIYESFKGRVIFKTKYNAYFKENLKVCFDRLSTSMTRSNSSDLPHSTLVLSPSTGSGWHLPKYSDSPREAYTIFRTVFPKSRGKSFRTSCAASAFEHPVQQHDWNHVTKHAPEGWKEQYGIETSDKAGDFEETCDVDALSHKKSKASWARLIQKIYEVDPMTCPKCSSEMRVIAIITSEYEVKKILLHLAKTGKSPPGLTEDN